MPAEVIENVITKFEVDVGAAIAALRQYANEEVVAGRTGGKALEDLGGSAERAGRAHDGLGGGIRSLKREMSGSMRTANFFARSLNDIVPASSLAGEGIRLLTSGLISGLGIGFGIEAVLAGVKLFADHLKESSAEEAKAKEEAEKHAKALDTLVGSWRDFNREQQSEGMNPAAAKFLKERSDAQKELNDAIIKQADAQATLDESTRDLARIDAEAAKSRSDEPVGWDAVTTATKGTTQAKKDLAKANEEVTRAQQKLDAIGGGFATGAVVANTRASQKLVQEAEVIGLTERQKLKVEFNRQMASEDAKNAQYALAAKQLYEAKITEIAKKEYAERVKANNEYLGAILKSEEAAQAKREEAFLAGAKLRTDEREKQKYIAEVREITGIGDRELAARLQASDKYYDALIQSEGASEDFRTQMALAKTTERNRILREAETEHANAVFEIDYNMAQEREQQMKARLQTAIQEAQGIALAFTQAWLGSWSASSTVNRRYTAEFQKLSQQRRSQQLLESGVVGDTAQAHAMAAQEAAAAQAQQTAAEKQGIADRMAALAMEWAIRAIAAAASQNWGAAAAYAAAAAAAGALAMKFHGEAARITASRGYTAEERDQLTQLRSDIAGGGSASSSTGGGARSVSGEEVTRERVIIYVGDPFMTPAENARAIARRMDLIDRLDLRGDGITSQLGG